MPLQTPLIGPLTDEGVEGADKIVADRTTPFPHAFPALTEMVPLTKAAPMVMLMLVVPCPEFMVVPAGKVQV